MRFCSILLCFLTIFLSPSIIQAAKTNQVNNSIKVPNNKITIKEEIPPIPIYKVPILTEDALQDKDFLNRNIGIIADQEDLTRRGEITFFSSFSYIWVYQLIIFDILFASYFNDMQQSGKLSATNFIYSILSTILISLMVTRKDTQFIQTVHYNEPVAEFTSKKKNYYREQTHELKFMVNLLNYDF